MAKALEELKTMESHGQCRIFRTGSRDHIRRTVYEDNEHRFWINYFGVAIEVKRGIMSYYTVEQY